MVDHINSFALNILKITGADIDTSRQWQFTNYIPETVDYLESYDKSSNTKSFNYRNIHSNPTNRRPCRI
jgi:hypothetical protein